MVMEYLDRVEIEIGRWNRPPWHDLVSSAPFLSFNGKVSAVRRQGCCFSYVFEFFSQQTTSCRALISKIDLSPSLTRGP